ncbi:MAG: Hsp70 family protein, partial [Myxococcota bacterium]
NVVEVLATAGDNNLGGDNIDALIIDYLAREFKNDNEVDVSGDKMALQRLKDAAEKAKIELSSTLETHINLPFLTADASGPKHLNIRMSRAKLEYLIIDLVERTLEPCRQALTDAGKRVTDIEDVILVGGSTRIPLVQTTVENFFGQPPVHRVNPDEVVALGAAVQAAVLSGDIKDLITLDVTSLTLGVETRGGIMATLIERNTTIPVKRAKTFTTAVDNQHQVEIHVVQGEREFVKDNISLGRFILDNIPPAPRAKPNIEVTFDIDANGIVNVSAREESTGRVQEITVQPRGGLSDGDIRRLVEEAAESAEADKQQRRTIEARNRLDGMIMGARRALRSDDDVPADEERAALRSSLTEAETALKEEQTPIEALHEANDAVARAMTALSNAITTARKAREEEAQAEANASDTDDTATEDDEPQPNTSSDNTTSDDAAPDETLN